MSEESVLSKVEKWDVTLVATISFEERATSVANLLSLSGCKSLRYYVFGYNTDAVPADLDRELRSWSRKQFIGSLGESRGSFLDGVNPYSMSGLREAVNKIMEREAGRTLVVDLTSMTKVHVLAWASVLSAKVRRGEVARTIFAYTSPDSYGIQKGDRPGWRDTLLLPIGPPKLLRKEGHSRGVILAGHDGERLSLALEELEPGSGVFIYSTTASRPDLMQKARELNEPVSSRLLSLKLPRWGERGQAIPEEGWSEKTVRVDGYAEVCAATLEQIEAALRDEGPVIFFPFGPKNLTLAVGVCLAEADCVSSWAVYPVPEFYPVGYSRGSAEIHWMAPRSDVERKLAM